MIDLAHLPQSIYLSVTQTGLGTRQGLTAPCVPGEYVQRAQRTLSES